MTTTMTYAINRAGQDLGTFTLEQAQELIRSGQALATDLVWREGLPEWRRLGEMPELASLLPPPAQSSLVSSTGIPGLHTSAEGAAKNDEFLEKQRTGRRRRLKIWSAVIAIPLVVLIGIYFGYPSLRGPMENAFGVVWIFVFLIGFLVTSIRGGGGGSGGSSGGGCGSSCSSCGGGGD